MRPQFTPEAELSRRTWLKAAGALIVGFSASELAPPAAGQTGPPYPAIPANQVDSWIAIGADESVTGYVGKCDFGQGFRTVHRQLIAEELQVAIDRVKLVICDTAMCPDQGVSSGSQAHPTQFGNAALRQALATAREALMRMASQQLQAPMSELRIVQGLITVNNDPSKSTTYGALIGGRKMTLAVNAQAKPRDPKEYNILGTSVLREDIPAKVTGEFQYVHHVRVPGMLHGKVVRPPVVGAKLIRVNENSVKDLPGNVRVVTKADFVGVVADREWDAMQGALRLEVEWSEGVALPNQADLYNYMRRQPTRDAYVVLAPDVDEKLAGAAQRFSGTYLHPFQMHGSMGTSCAVADVKGAGESGSATIWCASQGVYPQRDSVATIIGIPRTNIRVIHVEGSGCYGLNGADNVCYDAAILSQGVGRPVRLQYSRKDEMVAAESYGPAFVVDLKAGVDAQGQIVAWDHEAWLFAKGGRPNATTPGNIYTGALVGQPTPAIVPARATPPTTYNNGSNASSSYGAGCVGASCGGTGNIRSERVLTHTIQSPFFTGPLRSPNRLQNNFAHESFLDEIAAALKQDPVQYRLRHLSDQRLMDCVTGAARGANWDTRPSPKPGNPRTGVVTGRGIACVLYEGDNGYCAVVAEVRIDQSDGTVIVTRISASQDSGPVSNPDGIRNQMEGGAMQGMSRALFEEVRWNSTRVTSVDWRTFPVYRFGGVVPEFTNVVIDRPDVEHMGAGECTITVMAAAIANAIFDATGARVRQVPFTPARVLEALRARS